MSTTPCNILITGASRGIGAAIAVALSAPGRHIIINYKHDESAAQSVAARCREKGAQALCIAADVSDPDAVASMFDRAEKAFGPVDSLINNAGISVYGMIQDISPEQWHQVFDTNVTGVFLCTKRAVPGMISNRWGRIINIASVWGMVGAACESLYAATKGAVIAFTKSCAKELAYSGITVNAVAPGAVATDMMGQLSEADRRAVVEDIPLGRLLSPEEIAALVAHLIAGAAAGLTGQVISPNGGMLIV